MDLNAIVAGAIGTVNPNAPVTIQVSTGYVTNADGSRSPSYAAPQMIAAQVQALSYGDIVHADGLGIQGTRRKLYIHGAVNGLVRAQNKGGDLVTLADGTVWKIALILEQWPDWASAIITLQDGA